MPQQCTEMMSHSVLSSATQNLLGRAMEVHYTHGLHRMVAGGALKVIANADISSAGCRLVPSFQQPVVMHKGPSPAPGHQMCSSRPSDVQGRVIITGGVGSLGSLVAAWVTILAGSTGQIGRNSGLHLVLAARVAHVDAVAHALAHQPAMTSTCWEIVQSDLGLDADAARLTRPLEQVHWLLLCRTFCTR